MESNILIKIFIKLTIILVLLLLITGCRSANVVSHNLSKDADEFKIRRRLVFINLRTNDYIFEMEGLCSVDVDMDNDLDIICKVGEDEYQKHFVHLTEEVTYTIEQLSENKENKYKYKINFKPQQIIPIEFDIIND